MTPKQRFRFLTYTDQISKIKGSEQERITFHTSYKYLYEKHISLIKVKDLDNERKHHKDTWGMLDS